MKLIIQTNLNPIKYADGYCCNEIINFIENKKDFYIITTGDTYGKISINGISGMSFQNMHLNKLCRLMYSLVLFPDINHKLIKKVKDFISDNIIDEIDEIYSFSGDFIAQVIAYEIKKNNTNIVYNCILYDPLPPNNFIYKGKLNLLDNKHKIFKNVLKYSDNIFCTPGLYNFYCKIINKNIKMCGIPLLKKIELKTIKKEKDFEIINFLYCGSINGKVRKIDSFIDFLKIMEIQKIKYNVFFAGIFDNSLKKKFSKFNVKFLGKLSKNEIYEQYCKADVLISFGNNNSLQTPSKILEYISTCKKIISFEQIYTSQSYEILKKYKNSFVVFDNMNINIGEVINFLIKDNESINFNDLYNEYYLYTGEYNYELIFKGKK